MASGNLYTKYGAANINPRNSLAISTNAVGRALKDSISSVRNLLSEQEKKYTETNTIAATEALKKYVRDTGLSAEKVNTEQIRQHFGSMVDTDAVKKAVEEERNSIFDKALTTADETGADTYHKTGYIGDAQEAVKKALLDAGAKHDEAVTAANTWATNNQWRREEDKQQEDEAIQVLQADAIKGIQSGKSKADILTQIRHLPKKLQGKAYTVLNDMYDKASKLSPEERDNMNLVHSTAASAITAFNQNVDAQMNQEIATLEEPSQFVDADIKAAVTNKTTKGFALSGSTNAVGEATDNSWYLDIINAGVDVPRSTENETVNSSAATRLVQSKINYLTDTLHVPVQDAKMIALQAARNALPEASKGSFGNSLTTKTYNDYIRRGYKSYVDAKKAQTKIATIKRNAAITKLKYTQAASQAVNNYSTSAHKRARLGRNNTDTAKSIIDKLLGSSLSSVKLLPDNYDANFTQSYFKEKDAAKALYTEGKKVTEVSNKQAALQARLKAIKQSKATEPNIGGKRFKVSPPPKSKKSNDYWTEVAGN